jgi:hemoglobin/transferrin/lactoferrin receptor protein
MSLATIKEISEMQVLLRVALMVILVASVPAFAQEAEPVNPSNDDVEQSAEEKAAAEGRVFRDQIVVTPGRQEQASGDAPAPVTVFDRETIEKIQPEKMADLFKAVPGVEIDGEGPFRGLPVIRGLSSNRVLILVDGQRLNNSRESTTFAGIQPALVNLAEVERIEVLRGPASVQYGSDAIGGVVNIITRQPNLGAQDFRVNGDVAIEYGTISDSRLGRASVTGTGRGFSFYAGATYEKVEDYTAAKGAHEDSRYAPYVRDDDSVPNSGMEQTNFNGGLKFLTGQQSVLRIDAEVVRTQDVGFPGFELSDSGGIEFTFPNFDRDKIGVAWNSGPVLGLSDISLSTYYQAVNKESASVFDFFPGFFSDDFTKSEINSIGFNAQSTAAVGAHSLTFGLDFYTDNVEDEALSTGCFFPACLSGNFEVSTEVAVPKSEQTGFGVYVQDGWTLSQRVKLQLGLRGDSFKFDSKDDPNFFGDPIDETDSAVSGNVGIIWSVTDHVNLNALVARGFRTPNLQERSFFGLATNGEAYILQNPGLSSESSWNYEIGTKVRYDRYSGGLHFFYNDLSDFITLNFLEPGDPDFQNCTSPPAPPGVPCAQFANIAKATIWGIEFDLETIFANWWTAFTSIAYMEGEDKTEGEPLSTIPPLKVLLGLRYQRSAWWTEANLRFLDRQTDLPENDPFFDTGTVGFTVYDLRGGYDFNFGLGFLVAIENITDKLFNEPFNNRPEPGRNVRATVRYRF